MEEVHTPAEYAVGESDTCLTALLGSAAARPYGVIFTRPQNFEWVNVTAAEFIAEVYEVAKGFIANGVQQGDRIALLSETRYEWSLLDFAIWAAGAVSVPIYGSSSLSQIEWIIEESGAGVGADAGPVQPDENDGGEKHADEEVSPLVDDGDRGAGVPDRNNDGEENMDGEGDAGGEESVKLHAS